MDQTAFCVVCQSKQTIKNPILTKIRNRKSRTGSVEAWKGQCGRCGHKLYRIIGKG